MTSSRPEKKHIERALKLVNEPILIVDSDLHVTWLNQAAGNGSEDLVEIPLGDYLSAAKLTSQYFSDQEILDLDEQLRTLPFGEVRWLAKTIPQANQQRSLLVIRWQLLSESPQRFLLLTFQDRGRRRSDPGPAEQALRSQQKFINHVIHELRTPLAITMGSLRRLERKLNKLPAHPAEEHLLVSQQEVKRIQRLIDHLIILTDLDARSSHWSLKAIVFSELLSIWREGFYGHDKARLIVHLEPGCESHFVRVDNEAMKIVLDNLVDNAIKFSPSDAPILVYAKSCDSEICLYIADWGKGIPPSLVEHVFSRFLRLEEHRDPDLADGAGLGLAVSRELLNYQGAQIRILLPEKQEKQPADPVTVFEISFPSQGRVKSQSHLLVDSMADYRQSEDEELIQSFSAYLSLCAT